MNNLVLILVCGWSVLTVQTPISSVLERRMVKAITTVTIAAVFIIFFFTFTVKGGMNDFSAHLLHGNHLDRTVISEARGSTRVREWDSGIFTLCSVSWKICELVKSYIIKS